MTVQELKDALAALPPDQDVVIEDADTSWLLPVRTVECKNEVVVIAGYYCDEAVP